MSDSPLESAAQEAANDESQDSQAYRTRPSTTTGMPGGIPYIIGNEAAERFSFYGMKSILTIFMTDYLHWMGSVQEGAGMSNAEATEHYHTFTAAAYFFPVLGALVSDIFLGKYRTILYLSIVYCLGHAALAFMGAPPFSAGMWLFAGLLLIAVGSGGIKPCVSAHVGDQFGKANQHLLTKVYQWFYFSINLGAFVSTLLTPWLLEHYGPHWAFGVPGVLMAVATFLFWLGRNKFIHIPPGGMKFVEETFSWTGISAILKLMVIFSFVAVFWALFDQTGSSWVLQAKSLDRNWMGVTWLESQIQAINPILILILIPVFQFIIYPLINSIFTLTPIRKISIGLFVMAGGFAIVAWLQQMIDAGKQPSIAWQFLAYGVLTASEVMVSITCLEFAYTQAPKNMKSVVMAVFLFSVSMGNIFTAVVNNFIQTPAVDSVATGLKWDNVTSGQRIDSDDFEAVAETDERQIIVLGPDGTKGTEDDVVLKISSDGGIDELSDASKSVFEEAAEKLEKAFFSQTESSETDSLLSVAEGQKLIEGMTDAFGNPIRYKLISRDRYQLLSEGADKIDGTKWDFTLTGTLERAKSSSDDQATTKEPTFNWLERKRIEMIGQGDAEKIATIKQEIIGARGGGESTTFSRRIAIGGRTLLEGEDYFWFWTKCILVTAFVFVPVGYLYKEKTYIQDDAGVDEDAQAIADESAGH